MLDRIRASLPSLSPAEQRVGQLMSTDLKAFVALPVGELAWRAKVSKPTVVRFCRSVGYDGLLDFKRKLGGSVNEGVPFIHHSVDADDKTVDVVVKVLDNTVATFMAYRSHASTASFDSAADALSEACKRGKRIEFFGAGTSGGVAQDAQQKFFRLGVNSVAYTDSHFQAMSATMLRSGDCLVIISNSGRTRELLDAGNIARKNGATIIAITASGSPLALIGNFHLAADHSEHYECYVPMVSRLLHMLIVDILFTCVALRIGCDKLQPMLREAKHNLRNKRYG
ncbi:MAG: SIS domain-containing protein [Rhodoferax sp.]|nr:SIS domain-containing protein [Rhodoferax sp.]MDP3651395.1 SIS domain-containing protein [Rhodoferax sp.]